MPVGNPLPARNHYVVAELNGLHPLHKHGLHYRVDVEDIEAGFAYTDSEDIANVIAHALNEEVKRT